MEGSNLLESFCNPLCMIDADATSRKCNCFSFLCHDDFWVPVQQKTDGVYLHLHFMRARTVRGMIGIPRFHKSCASSCAANCQMQLTLILVLAYDKQRNKGTC